jgi:hypothetical protein
MLGVPVVFAMRVGPLERLPGIIGKAMSPEQWCIAGISRIVDSDDATRAELGDEEGIAIAGVVLDAARKEQARRIYDSLEPYSGFSPFASRVIFPIDSVFARRSYRRSKREWKRSGAAPGT